MFDITGLLEVMDKESVLKIKTELEKVSKEKWDYYISEKRVGRGSYKEYYAYIWKKNRVRFIKSHGFYKEKNNEFEREPYGADFKVGNFDFTLVLIHCIFGESKEEREKEAFYFDKVYEYFQEINGKEQDVLIAGDFNLPAHDNSFRNIFKHKDKIYYGIDTSIKTTIGKNGMANSYDNMFYSYKYTTEFSGNSGAFDFTNNNYKLVRKIISDHLPVYMEFYIDMKDDD